MRGSPNTPPMTQPAGDYDFQAHSSTSRPRYYYPAVPPLQTLPTVYSRDTGDRSVEKYHIPHAPGYSSVSSDMSGSSASSELKIYPPNKTYQHSSQVERGFREDLDLGARSPYTSTPSPDSIPGSSHRPPAAIEDNTTVYYVGPKDNTPDEDEDEQTHALWVLMWLSFFDFFYCVFSALFSILTLFILLLLVPTRLCRSQSSFGTSLIRIVAPVFRKQLQMLCAPSVDNAHTFEFRPFCLVLVHVCSPLLSVGVAVASWVAAAFWLFAICMGNPDGTERKDDGQATVLGVRNWWEKYLLYAIR